MPASSVARETIVRSTVSRSSVELDRLTDFAQRLQLADRSRELAGPRLELLEQPHVLDRDHRLVGKGLEQRDLIVRKSAGLGAAHIDRADGLSVPQEGNRQDGAKTGQLRGRTDRIPGFHDGVRNHDDAAGENGAARPESLLDWSRIHATQGVGSFPAHVRDARMCISRAFERHDIRYAGAAKRQRGRRDRVEHRLHVLSATG